MTMIVEIEELSEAVLQDDVPCEIWEDYRARRKCGVPSVSRFRIRCQECGNQGTGFVCQPCSASLLAHELQCTHCSSIEYDWSEL